MAEPQRDDDYYYGYQQQPISYTTQTQTRTRKGIKFNPSTSQIIVLATLVPFGATLLILAGLTLTATVIGLAITTPLFIFFSPVLFAAAVVIGFAIAGFLTSGAFSITSLSSFAWVASYLRRTRFFDQLKIKHNQKLGRLEVDDNLGQQAQININQAQIIEDVSNRVESKAQYKVQEAQSDQRPVGKTRKETVKSS
ncbi:oleosin [Trifolium pratense]|uniref:Oleosin n=1 Tax=Trifolium pratense TaxID=57577 RepID=A0A2K3MYE6_TRIPR|nr:oleosin H2-like [Trifolium pratense]PNX95759.1 oleosin [Trifolium pratense]